MVAGGGAGGKAKVVKPESLGAPILLHGSFKGSEEKKVKIWTQTGLKRLPGVHRF